MNSNHESLNIVNSLDLNSNRISNKCSNKDIVNDFNHSMNKPSNLKIKLLNVQCLTQTKMIELEENMDKETIFFLTEMHKR